MYLKSGDSCSIILSWHQYLWQLWNKKWREILKWIFFIPITVLSLQSGARYCCHAYWSQEFCCLSYWCGQWCCLFTPAHIYLSFLFFASIIDSSRVKTDFLRDNLHVFIPNFDFRIGEIWHLLWVGEIKNSVVCIIEADIDIVVDFICSCP